MIRRFDAWLGSRVFVPIIIWMCQRFGTTQWRVHSFGWMLVSWMWLYAAAQKLPPSKWGLSISIAFAFTWLAGTMPDREGESSLWFRVFWLVVESTHIASHVLGEKILFAGPHWSADCASVYVILLAEYALTIKTIPPREAGERHAKLREETT